MTEYKKEIVSYNNGYKYLIIIPVFYECENKPSWKTVYSGSFDDCKKAFSMFPDTLQATAEENAKNRYYMRLQADFYQSIGRYSVAQKIRKRYGF